MSFPEFQKRAFRKSVFLLEGPLSEMQKKFGNLLARLTHHLFGQHVLSLKMFEGHWTAGPARETTQGLKKIIFSARCLQTCPFVLEAN